MYIKQQIVLMVLEYFLIKKQYFFSLLKREHIKLLRHFFSKLFSTLPVQNDNVC